MIARRLIEFAEKPDETTHWRRPSNAGPNRCIRQLTYRARGFTPEPRPGRMQHVLDDSSWHAELMKDWLRRMGIDVMYEELPVQTPCSPHPGHIDCVAQFQDGTLRLIDFKAINHFSYERIRNGDLDSIRDYLHQLAQYLASGEMVGLGVTKGLLLVKNKNTSAYLELQVVYVKDQDYLVVQGAECSSGEPFDVHLSLSSVTLDDVLKFNIVEAHAKAGTLPARPFNYGIEFPCGYCPFEGECWKDYAFERKEAQDHLELDNVGRELAHAVAEARRAANAADRVKSEAEKELKGLLVKANARSASASGVSCALSWVEPLGKRPYEKLTVKVKGGEEESHGVSQGEGH